MYSQEFLEKQPFLCLELVTFSNIGHDECNFLDCQHNCLSNLLPLSYCPCVVAHLSSNVLHTLLHLLPCKVFFSQAKQVAEVKLS